MLMMTLIAVSLAGNTPCELQGQKIEARVKKGQPVFSQLLDIDAFKKRVVSHEPEASESYKKNFLKGFQAKFTETMANEDKSMYQMTHQGEGFTFLRCQKTELGEAALFRMDLDESGFSYIRFFLDAQSRVVDFQNLAVGPAQTISLGEFFKQAVATEDQGFLARLSGKNQKVQADYRKLGKMNEAILANNDQEAIRIYKTMESDVKTQRAVLGKYVQAATKISGEDNFAEYKLAVAEFEKYFPKDESLALKKIDVYFLQKDWPKALAAIESLDASVGGDPFLDTLRGNVYVYSGDLKKAQEVYRRAVVTAPKLPAAHFAWIGFLATNSKDYTELSRAVDDVSDKLNVRMDVENADLFAEFRKSPQGKKWLKANKGK